MTKAKEKDDMKLIHAALFDQGQTPTIDCVNMTPHYTEANFTSLIETLQIYVNDHYKPIWGSGASLSIQPNIRPGNWGMLFVDRPDIADALGYHTLTDAGYPLSKVFVGLLKEIGEDPATTASHELEMLVNPGVQMLACNYAKNRMEAYETHDAVQATTFDLNGFKMSNFQYPAWFESFRPKGSAKFDHLGLCNKPFQVLKGGYMSVLPFGAKRWSQVFASKKDEKLFQKTMAMGLHARAALQPIEAHRYVKSKTKTPEQTRMVLAKFNIDIPQMTMVA